MTYTAAQFFALLCMAPCVQHGEVVQVPMPSYIVSYTRPVEMLPRAWYEGRLYVLVPETEL